MKLSIYFNGQFWLGLVEYTDEKGQLRIFQHVFGAEPKTADIFKFIYQDLARLLDQPWLVSEKAPLPAPRKLNPKRLQRQVVKASQKAPLTTKSQQILKEQQSAKKATKKKLKRKKSLAEKQTAFQQKQLKRKKKQRGH